MEIAIPYQGNDDDGDDDDDSDDDETFPNTPRLPTKAKLLLLLLLSGVGRILVWGPH